MGSCSRKLYTGQTTAAAFSRRISGCALSDVEILIIRRSALERKREMRQLTRRAIQSEVNNARPAWQCEFLPASRNRKGQVPPDLWTTPAFCENLGLKCGPVRVLSPETCGPRPNVYLRSVVLSRILSA